MTVWKIRQCVMYDNACIGRTVHLYLEGVKLVGTYVWYGG